MPRLSSPEYDPMMDELPPELVAQYRAEQRKQRIAQAMGDQAMQPLQAPEVKGRFQGAISPMAGLAQLAQAYLSSKIADKADTGMADVGRRGQEAYSNEVKRVGEVISGRPDEVLPPDQAGPPRPGQPAGTQEQIAQALLSSYAPSLRRMGEAAFKSNLDQQATQNLLRSFGGAGQGAQMPAGPTPSNVRDPAWDPSVLAQNPNSPKYGAGVVAPMDASRRAIIQQELNNPDNQKDPASWAALVKEAQAAGVVPGQAGALATGTPATPATPLEEYTRRQQYTPQQAQAMMASGNKPLMALGKSISDGYKQAEMETLVKQPGRQAVASQSQEAAAERQQVGIDAAAERQQKSLEKPQTPMQKQKFEKDITNDFKATGQAIQSMATMEKAVSDVVNSKGLSAREGYTGYLPPYLQGKDAMTAQNRIDTLKGKITSMGKTMAALSGSIGPMAVQEWKIVSDMVNAINPTAGNLSEQLNNVLIQSKGAAARVQDAYDRRYSEYFEKYPQFETGKIPVYPVETGAQTAAPAASGSGAVRTVDW